MVELLKTGPYMSQFVGSTSPSPGSGKVTPSAESIAAPCDMFTAHPRYNQELQLRKDSTVKCSVQLGQSGVAIGGSKLKLMMQPC
jgi:hypothetical protein